jgi:hypothetical protein
VCVSFLFDFFFFGRPSAAAVGPCFVSLSFFFPAAALYIYNKTFIKSSVLCALPTFRNVIGHSNLSVGGE